MGRSPRNIQGEQEFRQRQYVSDCVISKALPLLTVPTLLTRTWITPPLPLSHRRMLPLTRMKLWGSLLGTCLWGHIAIQIVIRRLPSRSYPPSKRRPRHPTHGVCKLTRLGQQMKLDLNVLHILPSNAHNQLSLQPLMRHNINAARPHPWRTLG